MPQNCMITLPSSQINVATPDYLWAPVGLVGLLLGHTHCMGSETCQALVKAWASLPWLLKVFKESQNLEKSGGLCQARAGGFELQPVCDP